MGDNEKEEQYDKEAAVLILKNLRRTFTDLQTKGNKAKVHQEILDAISMAVMSEEVQTQRLGKAYERLVCISDAQRRRGLNMLRGADECKRKKEDEKKHVREEGEKEKKTSKKRKAELSNYELQQREAQTSGSKAKKDLTFIKDYFHNNCSKVEIDKSRPKCYSRKHHLGKPMTCQPRVRRATKQDLVTVFLSSPEYSSWRKQNPGM